MNKEVKVRAGKLEAKAVLNETDTAAKIYEILPIDSGVSIWGEEIYFTIPVEMGLENAKETVNVGDIAYWPEGNALCIFFGTTPVSSGDEVRPISAVNLVGKVEGDRESYRELLRTLERGENISIF